MAQLLFLQGCRGLPLPLKGDLFGFNYNGKDYYYIRNGQNDIIGIVDTNGAQVVSYTYDTWGKLLGTTGTLASTVGAANPYRYRGYYYDLSSGLYYCGSRYYDPNTGRWLNADDTDVLKVDQESLIGDNLFAYGLNNPVNNSDPSGFFAQAIPVELIEIGLVIILVSAIMIYAQTPQSKRGLEGFYTALCLSTNNLKTTLINAWNASKAGLITFANSFVTDYSSIKLAKGGKQNIKDSGFIGVPNEELDRLYRDPSTSVQEKQRIKKEQKAIQQRNSSQKNKSQKKKK